MAPATMTHADGQARKALATRAPWLSVAQPIGEFVASLAAPLGGRRRAARTSPLCTPHLSKDVP